MRTFFYCLTFLLCTVANLLAADAIDVRSGAHDGFSRLVLDVRSGTRWNFENGDGWARINITGHADGFNVGRVFDRIDRTRIAEVKVTPASIRVRFACACSATAFEQGQNMIVLDVANRSDAVSPSAVLDSELSFGLPKPQTLRFALNTAAVSKPSEAPVEALGVQTLPLAENFAQADAAADTNLISANEVARLAEAQQEISAQFSAAATRGLLTPRARPIELPTAQRPPQIDTRIFDSSAALLTPEHQNREPSAGNVRITSSADIPVAGTLSSTATSLGMRCIDPQKVAIQDWVTTAPFSSQIGTLRNALYSEFDTLDETVAIALVRTYLHFGFGAEADQVLSLDRALAEENQPLAEMAEIMEFGYVRQSNHLRAFAECDSDIALWSILSMRSVDPAQSINTKAALRAVTALPLHLRNFLAPELSRRLLEYGAPEAAAAALRSLERTTHPLSPNANLAKADLELARGDIAQAQDRLAGVVTSNAEQSAEALIKFVESHLNADAQIDEGVATLVEAYALQFRDDPIGAELRRAHVLALGKSGQFNAAFAALDRVKDRGQKYTDFMLLSAILGLLAQNASDIEFLDHVFAQISTTLGAVDPVVSTTIAARLLDLGFAVEAENILMNRGEMPDTKAVRMLRAQIALSLSRPMEAQALLLGVDAPEADGLRAHAKAQAGAFDDAHRLFSRLGESGNSQQTAWLSDSWSVLVKDTEPVLGDVARVAQTQLEADTNLQGMLSRTSAAIDESAAARDVIADLLRMSTDPGTAEP